MSLFSILYWNLAESPTLQLHFDSNDITPHFQAGFRQPHFTHTQRHIHAALGEEKAMCMVKIAEFITFPPVSHPTLDPHSIGRTPQTQDSSVKTQHDLKIFRTLYSFSVINAITKAKLLFMSEPQEASPRHMVPSRKLVELYMILFNTTYHNKGPIIMHI